MWHSHFCEANGIRLHYTRAQANSGKPVLILLHGFSDHGLCWLPIANVLSASHDIIMVDARGHGRSDGPPTGYTHDDHAADVAGLIVGLDLSKPHVMGHSMGAVTALALAGTYPDLPGTILLEDPPPFWAQSAPSAEQTDRRKAMAQWMIELKRKTPDEMMDESRKGNPTWPEAERGPWVESKVRMSFNVLSGFGQVGLDLRAAVQRIICPALLITADVALGGIASAENAADLQSLVPHLRIAHVAGAGHNIRREQPTQFLRVVSEFIG